MYRNLKAEMAREGVRVKDIARLIECTSSAASAKILGKSKFRIEEAILIKERYFPKCDINYLYEDS